jgi:RelA/SpoT family (p)ppGpp synthetase
MLADIAEESTGMDPEADLQILLAECRRCLPRLDEDLIEKAFRFCVEIHQDDRRADGKPYYTHLLAVALIVVREIPLDDISVAAALLHDVVEDHEPRVNLDDLRARFGNKIAEIVDGVTKIRDISKSKEITRAESYRKLLLSLVNDVRVILIKFADRLHNMRTLEHLSPNSQRRIATETLEIYAPFAHRFGLGTIKWELEDLAFKYLHREQYDAIKKGLNSTRREREEYIQRFIDPIADRLKSHGICFDISGRPKHIYSIFNKMKLREKNLDDIYDLFAIRIILDTDDKNECFFVYGIVSEIYTPVPERFKDYISVPKKNNYQSLHTTVIGSDGKRVEVQIRTRSMHEIAEKGVAAHFTYKAQSFGRNISFGGKDLEEWANWMRDIFDNAGGGDEAVQQLLESFRLNLYQQEIQVFTPRGELRVLPLNSTPVDFAFDIHSAVGIHCIGAKVNGRIVPLDYKLQNGEQVEIITSKNQTPSRDWERFIVTHKAKYGIRKFLNEEKRKIQAEGRDIWERKAKKIGLHVDEDDLEKVVQSLKFENKGEFYYKLGTGEASLDMNAALIRKKTRPGARTEELPAQPEPRTESVLKTVRESTNGVFVIGSADASSLVVYDYAKCCNPVPGDHIVGLVATGTAIKVHRRTCKNMLEYQSRNDGRLVQLQWASVQQGDFISAIRLEGEDRPGLLSDITNAIVGYNNTNIRSVNINAIGSEFQGIVTVFVKNTEHLHRLFDKLRKIKGIKLIERFEG